MRNLVQPLVVVGFVDTGATMEGVRTLGRFVVDKRIIPSPSEVLLRHEVPYDSVVSGTAMFFVQGDLDRMRESATGGLSCSAEAGLGGNHRALFLNLLGHASWQEGDYERATKMAEESLALSRAAIDMVGMAESLLLLGNASVWRLRGQEQAKAYYEEGLAISRGEFGSASVSRALLNALGLTFLLRRDLERATELAEETVALSHLHLRSSWRTCLDNRNGAESGLRKWSRGDEEVQIGRLLRPKKCAREASSSFPNRFSTKVGA